jgi:L-iditol 2-dehydrogenase
MRLAVLTGPGRFELEEVPVPVPGPDELLVRVAACGVCASELEAWTGRSEPTYPLRLGHEVSGTVVEAGDRVSGFSPGDAVGVWVTERGFADHVVVRADYAFAAGDLPLDTVLAEPLACAVNAVELADVQLADDVVLIGAGFMGHLAQQLTTLRGPRQVIVADTRSDALAEARALGATRTVDVRTESLPDVVAELTGGGMADVTFECTGSPAVLASLGDVTRMSGKLVLVGFHQGPPRAIPLGAWNWMAYDIRNAHFREVPRILHGMRTGMRLLGAGALDLAPHVTHRFGLEDIAEAFDTALAKPDGFVKATVLGGEADGTG